MRPPVPRIPHHTSSLTMLILMHLPAMGLALHRASTGLRPRSTGRMHTGYDSLFNTPPFPLSTIETVASVRLRPQCCECWASHVNSRGIREPNYIGNRQLRTGLATLRSISRYTRRSARFKPTAGKDAVHANSPPRTVLKPPDITWSEPANFFLLTRKWLDERNGTTTCAEYYERTDLAVDARRRSLRLRRAPAA
jgi:hypothetical protein